MAKLRIFLPFQSLVEAHDNVLYKTYKASPVSPSLSPQAEHTDVIIREPLRVIGLYKTSSEPLVSFLSFLRQLEIIE